MTSLAPWVLQDLFKGPPGPLLQVLQTTKRECFLQSSVLLLQGSPAPVGAMLVLVGLLVLSPEALCSAPVPSAPVSSPFCLRGFIGPFREGLSSLRWNLVLMAGKIPATLGGKLNIWQL